MVNPFNVVTPPGWQLFDLSEPVEDASRALAATMVVDLPQKVRATARSRIEASVIAALTGLQEQGFLAALLDAHDPTESPSFPIIAIQGTDFIIDGEELDPMDFLLGLLAAGEYTVIEPPQMVGVKRSSQADSGQRLAETAQELSRGDIEIDTASVSHTTRQVEYIMGIPDLPECWLSVFATFGAPSTDEGHELLDAIEEFTDAWVETISWDVEVDDD